MGKAFQEGDSVSKGMEVRYRGNEWSEVSGPEGKVEVQSLPSGGVCDPEGRLQPRPADVGGS